jgi:putative copper export protein
MREAASWVEGSSPPPPDVAQFAAHGLEYLGLLAGIGSFVVRRVGRFRPRIEWAQPPMQNFFLVAVAGGGAVLILEPSRLVAVRVAAEALALVLCVQGRRFTILPTVLAAAVLPLTGHASQVHIESAGAEFADAVHVLSAAMWAGGVVALANLHPPAGWASPEARTLLERFGRVAVIAAGVTALTGVLRATEQLNGISDLWSTTYGIVLALKVAGVLAMAGLSVIWRRGVAVGRADALVVVGVAFATAALATLPPPA